MPTIPPHLLPVLLKLGITRPAESKWKRLDPWPSRRIRAHWYCECEGGRVELAFTWLGPRKVFIGQCATCGLISWREAVKE